MGLQKREQMNYLKVTDGKIRKKVDKHTAGAEERYVEITDETVYELVYTECEGRLIEIKSQTHEKYGTSYNLILVDETTGEKFSLQIAEKSRYFQSLVQFFPNIDLSKAIVVKPYNFKKDGRTNIGLNILQDGEKVENFYKEFNPKTEKTKYKNGLQNFDFSEVKGDKDEQEILRVKLLKFLRVEMKREMQRLMEFTEKHPVKIKAPSVPDKGRAANEEESGDEHESTRPEKKGSKGDGKKGSKGKKSGGKEDDLPY